MALPVAVITSEAVIPALASTSIASAASEALNAVVAPSLRASAVMEAISFSLAPAITPTLRIFCSKVAPTMALAVASPVAATVAAWSPRVTTFPSTSP